MQGDTKYCVDVQVLQLHWAPWQGTHTRLLVEVGRTDSTVNPPTQTVNAWHARLLESVGATVWYSELLQTRSGAHWRLFVDDGAIVSYSASEQYVSEEHTRCEVEVGACCSYSVLGSHVTLPCSCTVAQPLTREQVRVRTSAPAIGSVQGPHAPHL
jgi:hypothetical protein